MNRKELVQAYKEARRPMGVYRVHNVRDDRSMVGWSVDLPSILNRERTTLKFGGHRNAALQRDWATLGPDAFVFEVLDTLAPPEGQPDYDAKDDLRVLESMWMERLQLLY
jgi:hypothetical protein